MSGIGTRQTGIVNALHAISALSSFDINPIRDYDDAFRNLRQDALSVCYMGWESGGIGSGFPGAPLVGNKTMTIGRERWGIITIATSLRSPTDMETKSGGNYEILEAIRGIRSTSIGTDARGTSVYLLLQSETKERDPNHGSVLTPSGGPAAWVCLYTTTSMFA